MHGIESSESQNHNPEGQAHPIHLFTSGLNPPSDITALPGRYTGHAYTPPIMEHCPLPGGVSSCVGEFSLLESPSMF